MAHVRKRHILEPFDQMLKFARILGIIGHRQTGKSTFVESHSSEYFTLDDRKIFLQAKEDPTAFISQLKGKKSAIDECQLVPALFPALKVKIGTSSIPGRYILTGSVRFSSRNAIRESLTGRLVNQEILPLVLTELVSQPNSSAVVKLIQTTSLESYVRGLNLNSSLYREYRKHTEKYLRLGGLPGICFIRSPQVRKNILRDILETILDRDLRLVYPTTVSLDQLRSLCRYIAEDPMRPMNYQEVARDVGFTPATCKKILNSMESVFLVRRIPLMGDYKGELFWFEDQVERSYFSSAAIEEDDDCIGLLYRNIRAQFTYRVGEEAEFSSYRTRGGATVPLVLKSKNHLLGFIVVKNKKEITRSQMSSADSFLKKYEYARVIFVLSAENHSEVITQRIAMMPIEALVF